MKIKAQFWKLKSLNWYYRLMFIKPWYVFYFQTRLRGQAIHSSWLTGNDLAAQGNRILIDGFVNDTL